MASQARTEEAPARMSETEIGSPATAAVRLSLYAAFTLPLMVLQVLFVACGWRAKSKLPLWYHRRCLRILGIDVQQKGTISTRHPTLFASNHVSYWDITVLGSLVEGSFVAKSEVARWPFFGWLAKLQRTVFVERNPRKANHHKADIVRRLQAGDNLVLFAEGTSGDGNRVLPFKSALFAVAETEISGVQLQIQPVSLTYTRLDGIPLGRYLRPFFAWYGDMELAGHLWRAAGLGIVTVVVQFHPPVTLEEFGSRKALSDHCQRKSAEGVANALAGRESIGQNPAEALAPAK